MKNILFFLAIIVLAMSCVSGNEYEQMVKKGLRSGEKFNDLFLGVELGMSSDDFFDHAWDLNKKGVVKQGIGNMSVLYVIDSTDFEGIHGDINMDFYPDFHEEQLHRMPMKFTYVAWAPWIKHRDDDHLEQDVLTILKTWYGDDFLEVSDPDRGSVHIKVDGNRQIKVRKEERVVKVLMEDNSIINPLEKKQLTVR
ncbi:MAG: hypothetical protein AB8G22_11735 [Saprospiraceae bacterium]